MHTIVKRHFFKRVLFPNPDSQGQVQKMNISEKYIEIFLVPPFYPVLRCVDLNFGQSCAETKYYLVESLSNFAYIRNYILMTLYHNIISLKDHYSVVVRGLVYLSDPESYTGGSFHPGRVTNVGQVEG